MITHFVKYLYADSFFVHKRDDPMCIDFKRPKCNIAIVYICGRELFTLITESALLLQNRCYKVILTNDMNVLVKPGETVMLVTSPRPVWSFNIMGF